MHSGMATASSRQVGDQAAQVDRSRSRRGRSSARPTPINATITVQLGDVLDDRPVLLRVERHPVRQRGEPDTMPTATSTIGADSAHRLTSSGSTTASSRASPATRKVRSAVIAP